MSKSHVGSRVVAQTAIFVIAGYGSLAYAATAASDVEPPTNGLDEIVVTAQRRSENLENTPVAVSVIAGDALQKRSITSDADLQTAVPGLIVRQTQDSNQINYVIRGQSVDAYTSSSPAVASYLNEVQVPIASSSAFYDLDSVQVLKGPQGTLFGRNSTGGAVLFTTAKPTNELGGFIDAAGGNYSDYQVSGALNVPIVSDKVLARVAAFYQSRDGFQTNLYDNARVGKVDRYDLRASLTLKPVDGLKNDLVVGLAHSGGTSTSGVLYSVYANPRSSYVPLPLLFSPGLDFAFGHAGLWDAYLAAHPKAPAGGLAAYAAQQAAQGPYTVDLDSPLAHYSQTFTTSNVTTYDVGSNTQIKNIVGFTRATSRDLDDSDGSPYGAYEAGMTEGRQFDYKDVSEELQLIGKAFDERLSYVTGLYYYDERRLFVAAAQVADLSPISPAEFTHYDSLSKAQSYAAYAQGTYDLGELTGIHGLGATGGVRYTSEKASVQQYPDSSIYNSGVPGVNMLSKTNNEPSWQFGIQEQLNPELLGYVVTRRSFRSGGFNETAAPINAPAAAGGASFEPEIATDIEAGVKFQGDIAGVPSRVNIAIYNQWVSNIQRIVYVLSQGVPAGFTANVPKAEISGVEVDSQVNPVSWLKAGANVDFTDARFTNGRTVLFGAPVAYGPFADAPRWSGTVFAEASAPIDGNLSVALRGDIFEQSKSYFSSLNSTVNPGTELPGYALTNFHLRLEQSQAGWSISANLKNAFNRVYYTGGLPFGSLFGFNIGIPGDPRTYTLEGNYRF